MPSPTKGPALTHQHLLEDLEDTYVQAIYRYQVAFQNDPANAGIERAEMNRLEAQVRRMKYGY